MNQIFICFTFCKGSDKEEEGKEKEKGHHSDYEQLAEGEQPHADSDPDSPANMEVGTRKIYYQAEFKCMGDVLGDGKLNQREFTRLMQLLGLPDVAVNSKVLWDSTKKVERGKMHIDEYVAMMMQPGVAQKTCMWRELFAKFDTDGSGWASRNDIFTGLEEIGITVTKELREKIMAMDKKSAQDDRVNYGDFLKMQLLGK